MTATKEQDQSNIGSVAEQFRNYVGNDTPSHVDDLEPTGPDPERDPDPETVVTHPDTDLHPRPGQTLSERAREVKEERGQLTGGSENLAGNESGGNSQGTDEERNVGSAKQQSVSGATKKAPAKKAAAKKSTAKK